VFGALVAATYGVLMASHVVFGLFFGLSIACALRALALSFRRTQATSGLTSSWA
jgi:hypothetical protein